LKNSTLKWCGDRPRSGRKGEIPCSCNLALGGASWYLCFRGLSASTALQEWGMTPLRPPRGHPRTISVLNFSKNGHPRSKIGKRVVGSPEQDLLRGSATRPGPARVAFPTHSRSVWYPTHSRKILCVVHLNFRKSLIEIPRNGYGTMRAAAVTWQSPISPEMFLQMGLW